MISAPAVKGKSSVVIRSDNTAIGQEADIMREQMEFLIAGFNSECDCYNCVRYRRIRLTLLEIFKDKPKKKD
jgi:hypothetical protein